MTNVTFMPFKKKYEPVFLFLLFIPVLLLRVNVESTHYCTPDSKYYLEVSQNILSGLGFVGPKEFEFDSEKKQLIPLYDKTPFGNPDRYEKKYFSVWPLGYPACIVAVSYITTLPPLWASKILNIILLALDFYLLFLLLQGTSNIPIYYFCSYTMLEISSYTWSENLFIPFFLLLFLSLKKIHNTERISINNIVLLSLALIGMCMARYASVIFYVGTFAVLLYYFRKKQLHKVKSLFYGLAIATITFGLYLYNNFVQTGYVTGMPRSNTQEFTAMKLIGKFFMGLFNQLHLVKQFRFSGTFDFILYLFLVLIQLCLMTYLFFLIRNNSLVKSISQKSKLMIYMGLMYLAFLTYMTFTSVIDPFDYRTLLPFSFPVCIALLTEVDERLVLNRNTKAIWMIKGFFYFSLIMNLPKKYLIDLLF
jgi:hypothetical protein